jgi:hypothetical protein
MSCPVLYCVTLDAQTADYPSHPIPTIPGYAMKKLIIVSR